LVLNEVMSYLTNPDQDELWEWINNTRQETVRQSKMNWETTKKMEMLAYDPEKDLKVPDRSFFSTKGKHPKEGEWWKYDGQIEPDSAIDRLREEYGMTGEERSVRSMSRQPIRSPPIDPFDTDIEDFTLTSQLALGSPMSIDSVSSSQLPIGRPRASTNV
jgi:hypothetical protein